MLLKSCAVLLTLLSLGAAAGTEVYLDPNTALRGVYTECVFRFDWSCLQRRTLLFVDRLGRASEYPLLPGLSVVRTSLDDRPPLLEDEIITRDSDSLGEMVDTAIDTFFDEHVFRITFPRWFRDTGRSSKDHVDFFFGDIVQEAKANSNETAEARGASIGEERCGGGSCKKKGGKKKAKMLKKCLMAACMLIAGKAMLLAPMMMGIVKIMALKSIAMSGLSLLMSKIMIIKKIMKNKNMMMMMQDGWQPAGGGGGWDSTGGGAGGGGWQDGGAGGGAEGPYRRTAYYRSAPAYKQDIIHNTYSTLADDD